MLIDDRTNIEGSVTGGCVEGALVEEARAILAGGPPKLVTYGISDEQAAGVGLMCGGTVRVFVHEHDAEQLEVLEAVAEARAADRPVALATLLDGRPRRLADGDPRRPDRRRARGDRPARPLGRAATPAGSSTRDSREFAATATTAR